jgi:hypothetical protein
MGELINFNEICQRVNFSEVLEWLSIPYESKGDEIKGECFVANEKDGIWYYFNPHDRSQKGSVINFVSNAQGIGLREAGKRLKDHFLKEKKEEQPKRPIPTLELTYHPFLEDYASAQVCQFLNVGYCKQKSIMAGRICFKVGEHYIGYSPEKKDWFFPKGFKRDTLWNIDNCDSDVILLVKDPLIALKLIAKGYDSTASIMGTSPTGEQLKSLLNFELILKGF